MRELSRHFLIQIVKILCIFSLANFTYNVYGSSGYNSRFDIKFIEGVLNFTIKLDPGFKIYGNEASDAGMPTHIDLTGSKNLHNYQIIWPIPKKEYFHGMMFHYIYEGDVKIPVELKAETPSTSLDIKGIITYAICNDTCVPVTQEIELHIDSLENKKNNFIWVLVAALLGGMILNVMPCVLPVLMLKIFSITTNRNTGYKKHLFATIIGIFATFLTLALLTIWLKSLGIVFGMGATFQSPQFIIILCVIMVIFVSNLLGRIEVNVPDIVSSKLLGIDFINIYISSFMSGVISTIFATPCTAPFLGTAVSFAMTAEVGQIIQIFSFIALGFSMPYILLIIAPQLLYLLPKPGPWMLHLKKILALVMIITILWLLSILQVQLGLRATAGVIMLLLLMKFIFEQANIPRILRFLLGAILFFACMYLPEMAAQEDQAKINKEIKLWQPFSAYELQQALGAGKVVVVDFTADWCMTCRYNHFRLWDRTKTIKLLREQNIIAMKGDLTNRSPILQKYLHERRVYGIPYDVVYGPNAPSGIELPTMASYEDVKNAIARAK